MTDELEKYEQIKKENEKELTEKDLDNVSGGAFPTAVNDQITDAVTQ